MDHLELLTEFMDAVATREGKYFVGTVIEDLEVGQAVSTEEADELRAILDGL